MYVSCCVERFLLFSEASCSLFSSGVASSVGSSITYNAAHAVISASVNSSCALHRSLTKPLSKSPSTTIVELIALYFSPVHIPQIMTLCKSKSKANRQSARDTARFHSSSVTICISPSCLTCFWAVFLNRRICEWLWVHRIDYPLVPSFRESVQDLILSFHLVLLHNAKFS